MVKYVTKEGLAKLRKELRYLDKTRRKEIAAALNRAADFGDLSENAAYQEAKEAQAELETRVLELKKMLGSVVVAKKPQRSDVVKVGSTVLLSDENGEKQKFTIVGVEEADPSQGKISYNSPIGEALLEKSKGDLVEVKVPAGKIKYKIIQVSFDLL